MFISTSHIKCGILTLNTRKINNDSNDFYSEKNVFYYINRKTCVSFYSVSKYVNIKKCILQILTVYTCILLCIICRLICCGNRRLFVADCINIGYFIQWIRDSQWITLSNLVMLSNFDNPLYKTILGYLTFG